MLIYDLTSQGFEIKAQGDMLLVGPCERLNDEIDKQIRENKHQLISELRLLDVCREQGADPETVFMDVIAASGPEIAEVMEDPGLMQAVALSVIW